MPYSQQRVVISLTTIPPRLPKIKATLESLDRQPVDCIYLHLPDYCKKTNSTYAIPGWLSEDRFKRLKINRGIEDLGPITKLLPTLDLETDPNTLILICDDDHLYGAGWADSFIQHSHPKKFITGNGANTRCILSNSEFLAAGLVEQMHFSFPECFAGMLTRRENYDKDRLLFLSGLGDSCLFADDLVIGKQFCEKGLAMHWLGLDNIDIASLDHYGMREHSLAYFPQTGGNAENYKLAFPLLCLPSINKSAVDSLLRKIRQHNAKQQKGEA